MAKTLIRKSKFGICLSAFFIFSLFVKCSSVQSIYNSDYPLSSKTAKSNSGLVEFNIPTGWFVAEDNEHNVTDLWLVKDDYSATIKLFTLHLDKESKQKFGNNVLDKVTELQKLIVKSKLGKTFSGFTSEEIFEIKSGKCLAFQFLDEEKHPARTVIFQHNSQIFELSAFNLKNNNPEETFRIQNSLLTSLK